MGFDYEHFEVRPEHIKLLRTTYVSWCNTEFGAAEITIKINIDPKRPYGNSDVLGDIAEVLGYDFTQYMDEDDPNIDDVPNETLEELNLWHEGTKNALQIFLDTGEMKPGLYRREKWVGKWEKVI